MLFTGMRVKGYRSIADSGELELGAITLVTGKNNTGKSALLRALYMLQDSTVTQPGNIRIGESEAEITLTFDTFPHQLRRFTEFSQIFGSGTLTCTYNGSHIRATLRSAEDTKIISGFRMPAREPDNLMYPILSGRRITLYREQASQENAVTVAQTDNNLVSRVMSLSSSNVPEGARFAELCSDILGIHFNVTPGESGQQVLGIQVDRFTTIPLEAMGAGLSATLSLLVGLSVADNQIFIVEEPEDDLHPEALKKLLDAIGSAAGRNQFLISTHSSTVLTRLADQSSLKILRVDSDGKVPQTSSFQPVRNTNERFGLLQDLGYSLADFDMGQGWLIFEEASAERLVRQYLVPWFAPGLSKLRTVAARGTTRVRPLFDDFREMLLFAHLEPIYRYRAWVIVDRDTAGTSVIEELRRQYKNWPRENFVTWNHEMIEIYYPQFFKKRVDVVMQIEDRKKRQKAKEELFRDVLSWIEEDVPRAKIELEKSAEGAIEVLRTIESQLNQMNLAAMNDGPTTKT